MKRLYLKLERLGAKRPVILALIIACLPYISNVIIPNEINSFLLNHKFNRYIAFCLLTLQIFTFIVTIIYLKDKDSRKQLLKKIDGVLVKLDSPFETEYKSRGKEKFYDCEMVNSFNEFNQILSDVKAKWPNKFNDILPLVNTKRIGGGDWIPESELNGVKNSFLQLRMRIS